MFDESGSPTPVDTQEPITTETIEQTGGDAIAAVHQGDAQGAVEATVQGQLEEDREGDTSQPEDSSGSSSETQEPTQQPIQDPGGWEGIFRRPSSPATKGENADQTSPPETGAEPQIQNQDTEPPPEAPGLTLEQWMAEINQLPDSVLQATNWDKFLMAYARHEHQNRGDENHVEDDVSADGVGGEITSQMRERVKQLAETLLAVGINWAEAGYRDSSVSELLDFIMFGSDSGYAGTRFEPGVEFSPEKMVGVVEFKNKMQNVNEVGKALLAAIGQGDENLSKYGWKPDPTQLEELNQRAKTGNVDSGLLKDMFADLKVLWKNREGSWDAFAKIFYEKLFEKTDDRVLHPQVREFIEKTLVESGQWSTQLGNDWQ